MATGLFGSVAASVWAGSTRQADGPQTAALASGLTRARSCGCLIGARSMTERAKYASDPAGPGVSPRPAGLFQSWLSGSATARRDGIRPECPAAARLGTIV
jgi:hypothetical protein